MPAALTPTGVPRVKPVTLQTPMACRAERPEKVMVMLAVVPVGTSAMKRPMPSLACSSVALIPPTVTAVGVTVPGSVCSETMT